MAIFTEEELKSLSTSKGGEEKSSLFSDEELKSLRSGPSTSKKKEHTLAQQGGGVAQGVLDLLGAVPSVFVGAGHAGRELLRGKPSSEALASAREVMNEVNPANLVPGAETVRQTEGYKYSPGTLLAETLDTIGQGYGNIAAAGAKLVGGSDRFAGEAGASAELASMAGAIPGAMMRGAGGRSAISDKRYYDESPGARPMEVPSMSQIAAAREAQPTYASDRILEPYLKREQEQQKPTLFGEQLELDLQRPQDGKNARLQALIDDFEARQAARGEQINTYEAQLRQQQRLGTQVARSDEDAIARPLENRTPDMFAQSRMDQIDMLSEPPQTSASARNGRALDIERREGKLDDYYGDEGAKPLFMDPVQKTDAMFGRNDGLMRGGGHSPLSFTKSVNEPIQTSLDLPIPFQHEKGLPYRQVTPKEGRTLDGKFTPNAEKAQAARTKAEGISASGAQSNLFRGPGSRQRGAVDLRGSIVKNAEDAAKELKIAKERMQALLTGGVNPRSHTMARLRREIAQLEKQASPSPFTGPGNKQRGAIGSQEDLRKLFGTNPQEAAVKLYQRTKSPESFINAYKRYTSEPSDIKAKAVYVYAKNMAEGGPTSRGMTPTESAALKAGQPKTRDTSRSESPTHTRLKQYLGWDRRSGEEVLNSLVDENGKAVYVDENGVPKDLKGNAPLTQGQKYSRRHPILKWVYDKADWTDKQVNRVAAQILYGQKFDQGLGITSLRQAKRVADPNSAMYHFNRLKKEDKVQMIEVAKEFNGVKEPTYAELQAKGLSPAQIDAYQGIRRGLDRVWDEVIVPAHARLKAEAPGMKDLPGKIPGYIPVSWAGEYRVWGKNKNTGEYDFVVGVDSMRQAKKTIKQMEKDHGHTHRFAEEDISNTGNDFVSIPDAFVDAMRILGSQSPEGKLLMKTFQERVATRGFSARKLEREHVDASGKPTMRGYEGDLPGRHQANDFEASIEKYIKGGVKYAMNKEMLHDLDKVLKNPDVLDNYPNASEAARQQLDDYFGVDQAADGLIKDTMRSLGLRTRLPADTLTSIAKFNMFTKVMGARLGFYFAQGIQDVFVLPRMEQLKAMGLDANTTEALLKGFVDFHVGKGRHDDILWFKENGIIEPKFSEQILLSPKFTGKPHMTGKQVTDMITGNKLSALLDETVRFRSAMVFLNFFENARKPDGSSFTKAEAREAAAKNSLDIMIEYEAWKRSPMYRRMGIVGQGFSPLTTYSNSMYNRIQEYAAEMRDNPSKLKASKPLFILLGTIATLAGVSGLPGKAEWDQTADLINKLAGTEIPTATEKIIEYSNKADSKFVRDAAAFGLPSAVSGMNFSGVLGAQETFSTLLPNPTQDPTFDTAGKLFSGAASMAKGSMQTSAEEAEALKAVLPTAPGHGLVEQAYSPDSKFKLGSPSTWGEALPQNRDVMIAGNKDSEGKIQRTPTEQAARLVGLKSTDEAILDAKKYRMTVDKERMEQKRGRSSTVIVDSLVKGKNPPDQAFETYFKNGGDVRELDKAIWSKLEDRYETYTEREVKAALKNKNPRALMLLEEYGLFQDRQFGR